MEMLTPFGDGFAVAACLALALLLPQTDGLPDAVVADHIRALQPGHLMDVVSTDQHTVKPWFDGRLDYLTGKPVAALIYRRHGHVIDLFVWPDDGHVGYSPAEGARSGYDYIRWSRNSMEYWAVSDLATAELAEFAKLLQAN
jgi:anti-sigma factor RsiW